MCQRCPKRERLCSAQMSCSILPQLLLVLVLSSILPQQGCVHGFSTSKNTLHKKTIPTLLTGNSRLTSARKNRFNENNTGATEHLSAFLCDMDGGRDKSDRLCSQLNSSNISNNIIGSKRTVGFQQLWRFVQTLLSRWKSRHGSHGCRSIMLQSQQKQRRRWMMLVLCAVAITISSAVWTSSPAHATATSSVGLLQKAVPDLPYLTPWTTAATNELPAVAAAAAAAATTTTAAAATAASSTIVTSPTIPKKVIQILTATGALLLTVGGIASLGASDGSDRSKQSATIELGGFEAEPQRPSADAATRQSEITPSEIAAVQEDYEIIRRREQARDSKFNQAKALLNQINQSVGESSDVVASASGSTSTTTSTTRGGAAGASSKRTAQSDNHTGVSFLDKFRFGNKQERAELTQRKVEEITNEVEEAQRKTKKLRMTQQEIANQLQDDTRDNMADEKIEPMPPSLDETEFAAWLEANHDDDQPPTKQWKESDLFFASNAAKRKEAQAKAAYLQARAQAAARLAEGVAKLRNLTSYNNTSWSSVAKGSTNTERSGSSSTVESSTPPQQQQQQQQRTILQRLGLRPIKNQATPLGKNYVNYPPYLGYTMQPFPKTRVPTVDSIARPLTKAANRWQQQFLWSPKPPTTIPPSSTLLDDNNNNNNNNNPVATSKTTGLQVEKDQETAEKESARAEEQQSIAAVAAEKAARVQANAEEQQQKNQADTKKAEADRLKAEKQKAARLLPEQKKAEADGLLQEKLEKQKAAREAARLLAEQKKAEADRLFQEKLEKQKAAREAARLLAEQKKAEEQRLAIEAARLKAQTEKQMAAQAEQKKAEEQRVAAEVARLKAEAEQERVEEEARLKAEMKQATEHRLAEAARLKAEAEKKRMADEARIKAELQKAAAEAAARLKAEAEKKRIAAEAARIKAEAEQKRAEEEAARIKSEAEQKRAEEEEAARIKSEAERKRAEEEEAARIKSEAERKRAEEEEAARIESEAEQKRAEEEEAARIELEAEKKRAEEEVARIKAGAEKKRAEEEEAVRIESEAEKKRAEEEAARIKAGAENKKGEEVRRNEDEARIKEEDRAKAERIAESHRLAKEAQLRAEAAKRERAQKQKDAADMLKDGWFVFKSPLLDEPSSVEEEYATPFFVSEKQTTETGNTPETSDDNNMPQKRTGNTTETSDDNDIPQKTTSESTSLEESVKDEPLESEEDALKRKYASILDLGERCYQILVDLGMVIPSPFLSEENSKDE